MCTPMLRLIRWISRTARLDERGATAVEYAFIVLVIAMVMVAGAALLGDALLGLFNNAAGAF